MLQFNGNTQRTTLNFLGPIGVPGRFGLWGVLMLWYGRRRQRRHLASLDDFLLRDIGIDRMTADRESQKPFWQA